MKLTFENAAALLVGAAGIVYGWYANSRANKVLRKLDLALNTIDVNTLDVNVEDAVVEKAVNRAVEREAQNAARRVSERIITDVDAEVTRTVCDSVTRAYESVETKVAASLEKQAANVDISALRRDVISAAKKAVAEKLDGAMDEVLTNFNENLNGTAKIYQTIADKMAGKDGGAKTITIS
jgi:hypothetical protein